MVCITDAVEMCSNYFELYTYIRRETKNNEDFYVLMKSAREIFLELKGNTLHTTPQKE